MQQSDQRTAPRLYGKVFAVCDGAGEWCGATIEVNIDVPPEDTGLRREVECGSCGAEYVVGVYVEKLGEGNEGAR